MTHVLLGVLTDGAAGGGDALLQLGDLLSSLDEQLGGGDGGERLPVDRRRPVTGRWRLARVIARFRRRVCQTSSKQSMLFS